MLWPTYLSKVIRISSFTEENSLNSSRLSQLSESSHAFLWRSSVASLWSRLNYPLLDSCSHQHQSLSPKMGFCERNMEEIEMECSRPHQEYFWVRLSSMELGLFIFISLEPKSQWSATKKAKPLNVNGPWPTLTWKAWPLLRLVVIFLAHECVVIQSIFSLLLLYALKNCKSQSEEDKVSKTT